MVVLSLLFALSFLLHQRFRVDKPGLGMTAPIWVNKKDVNNSRRDNSEPLNTCKEKTKRT